MLQISMLQYLQNSHFEMQVVVRSTDIFMLNIGVFYFSKILSNIQNILISYNANGLSEHISKTF